MGAPVFPTIIPGPAVIQHNGASFYSKEAINIKYTADKFQVKSAVAGNIDTRKKGDKFTITWTPDGQVANMAKYFPYSAASIGKSIFPASTAANVTIWTVEGHKHVFQRGAITKCPQLNLSPIETLFGDMEITCIGKPATQRTDAAYFKALTAAAFADTTFDETTIKMAPYTAAWGATAPYDAMGSLDGFKVNINVRVAEIGSSEWGIADITLQEMEAQASFIPATLTEAAFDALINFQDSAVIQIGDSFAKAGHDLVIDSDVFTATIYKAGPCDFDQMADAAKHRHGEVHFIQKRTWTAGAANPLFLFTIK